MKFTVDRSRWLRGEGEDSSSLLRREDQKMCCLGFLACELGYSKEDIVGETCPASIIDKCDQDKWPANFATKDYNSSASFDLMSINDDEKSSDSHKELKIAKIFKDIFNIDVEFVN